LSAIHQTQQRTETHKQPKKSKEIIMGLMTDASRFKALQNKLQTEHQNRGKGKTYSKEGQLTMEPGNTYKLRIIPYIPEDSERELPFVCKHKHMLKGDDGKWHGITCPTTQFPQTGFDKCPMCSNNRTLWNSGTDADKELYKLFKRRFDGYALVYVVSDPTNSDNEGTVKSLRYGIGIHKFLQKEIFGIGDANDDVNEDTIGLDALSLTDGFDLIITVSKKGQWNDYECKFARKASTLNVDVADIEAQCKELNIDSELKPATEADLQEYFNNYVLADNTTSGDDINISETPAAAPAADKEVTEDMKALLDDLEGDSESTEVKADSDSDTTLSDIDALLNDI
jgi:hypothetical protein